MCHLFMQRRDYFYQSQYTVNDVNYFICNVFAYWNILNGEKFSSAMFYVSVEDFDDFFLHLVKKSFILKLSFIFFL